MDTELTLWIIAAVMFAVVELATGAFVAIYIALGAVAAAIVVGAGGDMIVQLAAFAGASLALLIVTRPVLKRKLEAPDIPTNVYTIVGKTGIVTLEIDNDGNTGQIRIGTELWTARTPEQHERGAVIPIDTRVEVVAVEGVTARVVPREPAN